MSPDLSRGRHGQLLGARSMSVWYFSRMCRVSSRLVGVDRLDARGPPGSGPSRASRRPTGTSSARGSGATARSGRPGRPARSLIPGTRVTMMSRSVRARGSRCAGTGSAASSASDSSRVLLEVRKTSGIWVGPHRAELGDRHLVLREDLEEQRLGLELDPVDLVDEQHDRLGRPDRLEQRPGEEELLGEDVLLRRRSHDVAPGPVVARLDAQQLLLVVPFVEGLRLVETLVALQTDEPAAGEPGPPTWPARSCRCRPDPRRGPAWPAGRPGRRRRRCRRRPGSRRPASPDARQRWTSNRGGTGSGNPRRSGARFAAADRCRSPGHDRTCPVPWTTYFDQVSSRSPIGPRACSFWVEMPISAPSPSSPPSTNRVEALTTTPPRRPPRHEALGARPGRRHDGFGVARAVAGDVVDGGVEVVDDGHGHHQIRGIRCEVVLVGRRRRASRARTRRRRDLDAGQASSEPARPGRNVAATSLVHEQGLGGVADPGALRLGVEHDVDAPCRGRPTAST